MPKVTIWVRVDDLDKWNAIKSKPEFIHNALNTNYQKQTLQTLPPIVLKGKPPKDTWQGSNFKKGKNV